MPLLHLILVSSAKFKNELFGSRVNYEVKCVNLYINKKVTKLNLQKLFSAVFQF